MSQATKESKPVWYADLGNGEFRNPILFADYSDPDIVRVGEDFYMTASSFVHTPGLPILHSKDLVNWTLIGHAIDKLPSSFDGSVRHGDGVWAPSIRYHDGKFWIYFGAPDEGIYMTTAVNPAGPWTPLHLVKEVKGWIDTCPFWDEDGQAYLVHAFANSRCGIKHKLNICRMAPDGKSLLDEGQLVFDGTESHPTMEGPKLYKRNGYYYIFAPAGGVKPGWQVVLRSKNIMGPYEDRIVLHQGDSDVNGPHQGGYVELDSGESWFVHFQDRYAYGRIVHLQPMGWGEDDWPYMGIDTNGDGIGEPVAVHKKPNVGKEWPFAVPAMDDNFDSTSLGLQWQWQGNRQDGWYSLEANPGSLRLYAQTLPEGSEHLYQAPHIIGQKFPAPEFSFTTKLSFRADGGASKLTGMTVFGHKYCYAAVRTGADGSQLALVDGEGNKASSSEQTTAQLALPADAEVIYLRVRVVKEAVCTFEYSLTEDGVFEQLGDRFVAEAGHWVGARVCLFCAQEEGPGNGGFADFDWVRFE